MSNVAFIAVIASALFHAAYNLLIKVSDEKTIYMWSIFSVAVIAGWFVGFLMVPGFLEMKPSDFNITGEEETPEFIESLLEKKRLTVERNHKTKDGKPIFVEISAHLFTLGEDIVSLAIIRDVSERKKADEELIDREEKFRQIFQNSSDAIFIHSFFNHFIVPAVMLTLMQLIILPTLFLLIYHKSEKVLHEWLEIGLDVDVWMLEQISNGKFFNTKQGHYLDRIKDKFSPDILVDILCYLRLHLELAIRAKGLLMMQEAGISPKDDPEIREKFTELEILDKNIGRTGKLALAPILNSSVQEMWQLDYIKSIIKTES